MVGIQNNPLPIQGRITQVSSSQAKVNSTAPQSDAVLDLTQTEGLEKELTAHNATNTDYIRLSNETSVSLKELSPEEITEVIDAIKSRALDGDLKLIPGILPQNLITVSEQTVTISGGGNETIAEPESSPIEKAEAVIDKSNSDPNDKNWSFANGSASSLTFQKQSDKPAPWNNHFFMTDDKAFIYQTKNDQRSTSLTGEKSMPLTLDQAKNMGLPEELLVEVQQTGKLRYLPKENYQTMVKNDFNFNGAFNEFQSAEQFTEALQYTYPERVEALGKDNFNELATRIYSYANTAQDTDGGIDVQEMQGMLYALDPEVRLSSNSNTPMKAQALFQITEDQFQGLSQSEQHNYAPSNQGGYVPLSIGQDQYTTLSQDNQAKYTALGDRFIPLGDNKHGRATILTTRHIMENVKTTEIPSEPTSFKFNTGIGSMFGPNDRFIHDSSGSMNSKWGLVRDSVDKVLKDQGALQQNESLADKVDLKIEQKGSLSLEGSSIQVDKASLDQSEFKNNTDNLPLLVKDAYTSFQSPDKSAAENRQAFSDFVGLPEKDLFSETGEINSSKTKLTKAFDTLLHKQGRLKPEQKLADNLDALITKDGGLQLTADKVYNPTVMTLDDDDFDAYIQDFSNVLTDAYKAVASPDKSDAENQKTFADLLGVPAADIFNDKGQLQGDKAMNILGDSRGAASERSIGSTGEAAFKGVITSLLFDKDYSAGSRMNVLIDEPLQDMEYLKLAQSIADAKGVDVRFISMPTSVEGKNVQAAPEDYMIFVDLQSMDISYNSGNPQTLSFTSQSINDKGLIEETKQKMDIEYYDGKVHDHNVDFGKNPDGFKGAFLPLQGYDEKGKLINKIGSGTE